jgi:hypothetical protein
VLDYEKENPKMELSSRVSYCRCLGGGEKRNRSNLQLTRHSLEFITFLQRRKRKKNANAKEKMKKFNCRARGELGLETCWGHLKRERDDGEAGEA